MDCSIGSEVFSLVRASLSQKLNRPSEPTVANVPWTGWKRMSFTCGAHRQGWSGGVPQRRGGGTLMEKTPPVTVGNSYDHEGIVSGKVCYMSPFSIYQCSPITIDHHRPAPIATHREDVLVALVGAVGAVALEGEVVLGVGRVDVLDGHATFNAADGIAWGKSSGQHDTSGQPRGCWRDIGC